jgi:hypothetical protein
MKEIGASRLSNVFISDNRFLYEGQDLGNAMLVVPDNLTQPIIEMHHDMLFAGHKV